MRRLGSALVVAAIVSLGAASAVNAGRPSAEWIPAVEYDDPFVCGGDPVIHVSYTSPFRLVTWYDAEGNLVRDAIFAPGTRVVLTDTSTGRSLSGSSPAVFRTTYAEDGSVESLTVTGLNAAIAVPGHGIVLLDTGQITWQGGFQGPVLAERGPHGWLGSTDRDAFCGYFGS
jgi:hypothetical protein